MHQLETAVNVPRQDQNLALRPFHRLAQCMEVALTIDQKGHPIGMLDAPAVLTGFENRLSRHVAAVAPIGNDSRRTVPVVVSLQSDGRWALKPNRDGSIREDTRQLREILEPPKPGDAPRKISAAACIDPFSIVGRLFWVKQGVNGVIVILRPRDDDPARFVEPQQDRGDGPFALPAHGLFGVGSSTHASPSHNQPRA
jgi:hypothetical protein